MLLMLRQASIFFDKQATQLRAAQACKPLQAPAFHDRDN
jgi:hypothetical protein